MTNYDQEMKDFELLSDCKLEYARYLVCKNRGFFCFNKKRYEEDLELCIYMYQDRKFEEDIAKMCNQ